MKVLLAVDGSVYSKHMMAYLAAHEELLGHERQHTLIAVVPPVPPHAASYLDPAVLDAYYRDEADKVLKPLLAFAEQHGWKASALRPVGHAADLIAEAATDGGYDVIVMGSHGHTAAAGLLLGSVTQRVLARCKVPVLIVR